MTDSVDDRLGVEARATPADLAEVVGLCIPVGGMLTYQGSGRFVIRGAEGHYARLQPEPRTEGRGDRV